MIGFIHCESHYAHEPSGPNPVAWLLLFIFCNALAILLLLALVK